MRGPDRAMRNTGPEKSEKLRIVEGTDPEGTNTYG
jgi:hypothetical protein